MTSLATAPRRVERKLAPRSGALVPAAIWQPVLFFGAIFLIWEYGVVIFGIRPYLLPRFSAVIVAMWTSHVELLENTYVTLVEVLVGFVAAVVGGVGLGVLIYASPFARRTVYPFVTALQAMPKSALAPLMIVWFGYGLFSKGAMAFLFAFFPIVIATLGGFSGTATNLEEHLRALRASPWQTFTNLRLPSALPIFVDGCKVAMPLAVIGAIVGEFVGSQDGLGSYIMLAASSSRTDVMFAAIMIITILSMLLYGLIELVSRRVWWRGIQT